MVSVLVAVMLAGCSGSEPADDAPAPLVELEPGIVVAADRGVVRGDVRTDGGLPIPGARVHLLGDDEIVTVGQDGSFLFLNVTPGDQEMRTEAPNFHVDERTVAVKAANITEAAVNLLPTGAGAGYRPHAHDLWQGRERHTLFDAVVDFRPAPSEDPAGHASMIAHTPNSASDADRELLIPVPEEDDRDRPNLVYPGAARLEFTLDWDDGDWTNSALGIEFQQGNGPVTVLGPEAPGTVMAADIDPAEADSGHQAFTFWRFYLHVDNAMTGSGWEPAAAPGGEVHVRIEVVRGEEPPTDPAHHDFWQDATSLHLMDGSKAAFVEEGALPYKATSRPRDPVSNKHHMLLPDGTLVPPDTTRLRVNHTWEYQLADGDLAGTPADPGWVLTWRTADQNPLFTTLADYRREAEVTSCGTHCLSYDIALEPGQTDAFYQERSLWAFLPSVDGYEDESNLQPDARGDRTHYLDVRAYRT